MRVRSAIAILFRATLFLLCRNLSISGTKSPRLSDLRIKELEPKKLMVKREKEVVSEKKRKILITKKKLIKFVNSPAAAPKT